MVRLDRFAPPGMDTTRLHLGTGFAIIFSIVFSTIFLRDYFSVLRELQSTMENPVYPGMTMTPFSDLIVFPMIVFRMAPMVPLLDIPAQYAYFFQETKSIYLMKRLSSPKELLIRCLTLPIASSLLIIAVGCGVYLLYYLIYMTYTPEILLPAKF